METPKIEANGFTFRFAQPSDADAFVKWSTENGKIPRKDILASMAANNPTAVFFVIEKDGVPVLFAPFYCQMILAYLGFNPEAKRKERIEALQSLLWITSQFAFDHGVREIAVQTSKDYPVGRWALNNGFTPDNRETFKYRVLPLIDPDAPVKEAKNV